MKTFTSWIKQHALLVFYVLAVALSWWPWWLYVKGIGNFPPILPLGPLLAVLIVVPLASGWAGVKAFVRSTFRWRVGLHWYAIAVGFPIVVSGAAAGLNILLGATYTALVLPVSLTAVLLAILDMFLWVGLGEEAAWSAFALPHLLRRRSLLATVLILGSMRILWHLPLFMTGQQHWAIAVVLIPLQLIATWLFLRGRGSAFLVILVHLSQNVLGSIFFSLFTGPDQVRMNWLYAAVFVITTAALLLASKSLRTVLLAPETAVSSDAEVAINPL